MMAYKEIIAIIREYKLQKWLYICGWVINNLYLHIVLTGYETILIQNSYHPNYIPELMALKK